MKILVIGASGMLGSAMYNFLSDSNKYYVYGTTRADYSDKFSIFKNSKLMSSFDLADWNDAEKTIRSIDPDVVINCSGVIKQVDAIKNIDYTLYLNSVVPNRLEHLSLDVNFKLIHFSTDCVFDGQHGNYYESDLANATDQYALSKYLGEVKGSSSLTLRTSIIGHELSGHKSLIDWFLSQEGTVKGFDRAIFSGLPTNAVAEVVDKYVLDKPKLSGLYHLSSQAISKFDLLELVGRKYGKTIKLEKSHEVVIDRSLNSTAFSDATGFKPANWTHLVDAMYKFGKKYYV